MSRLCFKFLGTLMLFVSIALSSDLSAQCTADFEYTNQGLSYQFEDKSSPEIGDSIISWSWEFGDDQFDTVQNPNHQYIFPDSYEVTLTITTEDGCTNETSQIITNCSLVIDVQSGDVCIGSEQEYAIQITDIFGVVDSVNVSVDNIPLTPSRYAINRDLNLNISIPADNGIHNLSVTSEYSEECDEQFFLFPMDCTDQCKFNNLTVKANRKEVVEVRDTVFFPKNRIIALGDTVLWSWVSPANSSTSDSTSGPDMWDSGVLFVNDSFKISPQSLGVNPYYSKTRGGPGGEGMSGNIIVNCPLGLKKEIEISLDHENFVSAGFQVAIDGVIIQDSTFAYDISGTSTARVNLPADGIEHIISIIDLSNPNCHISTSAFIPDCGGSPDCNINVNGYAALGCENDSIEIILDVNSLGLSDQGISVLYNGAIIIDTIHADLTGKISKKYKLPFNAAIQRFTLRDIGNETCNTETIVATPSCQEECELSNLEILSSQNAIVEISIGDFGLGQENISLVSDNSILFQWDTNRGLGIRSIDGSWDSGIKQSGSIYISPFFEHGDRDYEVYDVNDEIISSGTISSWDSCEDGFVPFYISFMDTNGSNLGYSLFIDGVQVATDYNYNYGDKNQLGFQLIGDDATHTIMLVDNESEECKISGLFNAEACTEFECMLSVSASELDTCFNDNTKVIDIEVFNPVPFPRGFALLRDGEQVGEDEINYDLDSFTNTFDTLLADGSTYTLIAFDIFNESCADTLEFQSSVCLTECSLTEFNLRIVDEDYKQEFPNTPDVFVGCQPDSTSYVAVSFNEKYSDATQYAIFIDNELYTTVSYSDGDGANLAFIPVFSDSLTHTIRVSDLQDDNCSISGEILMPPCFKECIIFVDGFEVNECEQDSFELNVFLNRPVTSSEINIFESGSNLNFEIVSDTVNLKLKGDGETRTLVLTETENLLCQEPIDFNAPYCLECQLEYTLAQQDSCLNGDQIVYSIDISENEEQSLILVVNGLERIITNQSPAQFIIQSDGSSSTVELRSIEDRFCFETVTIETDDCSPVLCEVDFTIETEGLTAVFTDNSITTEEIISQNWTIAGGISVQDVNSFTWNFIAVGVYTVCHGIVTDSCTNTICKDINIDPCSNLEALFEISHLGGGTYEFTNISAGEADEYIYDFGDGNTSEEQNPTHTYASSGAYNVCLTVTNADFECSDTICQDIDFVSAVKDPVDDAEFKIYPNPSGEGDRIVVESSIPLKGYAIYTLDGRLIQSADISIGMDKMSIRLQEKTADGLLLLNIKTDKGVFVRKIVSKL